MTVMLLATVFHITRGEYFALPIDTNALRHQLQVLFGGQRPVSRDEILGAGTCPILHDPRVHASLVRQIAFPFDVAT